MDGELISVPQVTLLGPPDGARVPVRLSWRQGVVMVSPSRVRFLRDNLKVSVIDREENYVF